MLTTVSLWLPLALAVALFMDVWAALLHRFVWHGLLWAIHRTHHQPRRGLFERNDALSVAHAPIAIALILYGCTHPEARFGAWAFGIGVGMTLFGLSYLVFHDGLAHRRASIRALRRFPYVREVLLLHARHHQGEFGQAPYGFFLAPLAVRVQRALVAKARMTTLEKWKPPRTPTARTSVGQTDG
ncbi:MAG: beta-carotene hydroxylase [Polyangiaceae bacterium]